VDLLRPSLPNDQARTPLLDDAGRQLLRQMRDHPDAPHWTYAVGDRLDAQDLLEIERFRDLLAQPLWSPPAVHAQLVQRLPHIARLADWSGKVRQWAELPTSSRADLAMAPETFVPDDADLQRLVIYRTAGTTGHPIAVPHHPVAVAAYLPLVERAAALHGVVLEPSPGGVAAVLLSYQLRTYTYATVLYGWRGAGFAKLNLRPSDWPTPESLDRYLANLAPQLLTGEPVTFAELATREVTVRPRLLLSTSSALSPALRELLQARFGCPVVDWYSMVETGPIAASCRAQQGFHLLSPDLDIEIDPATADANGHGEILVSGGRNPFLPLVRYRTGDRARLEFSQCLCGDPMPRLVDLEGRRAVRLRAADGTPLGGVDVSRALRQFPLLAHQLHQHADGSCTVRLRPLPATEVPMADIGAVLRELFQGQQINLSIDNTLGDMAKIEPYLSDLLE
jgi:phenylacetate-CoA ligase